MMPAQITEGRGRIFYLILLDVLGGGRFVRDRGSQDSMPPPCDYRQNRQVEGQIRGMRWE
jgi:hypothetical protein